MSATVTKLNPAERRAQKAATLATNSREVHAARVESAQTAEDAATAAWGRIRAQMRRDNPEFAERVARRVTEALMMIADDEDGAFVQAARRRTFHAV